MKKIKITLNDIEVFVIYEFKNQIKNNKFFPSRDAEIIIISVNHNSVKINLSDEDIQKVKNEIFKFYDNWKM